MGTFLRSAHYFANGKCQYWYCEYADTEKIQWKRVDNIFQWTVIIKLESGQMPNVMAALPNIGGALCSTPQSMADAHQSAVQ